MSLTINSMLEYLQARLNIPESRLAVYENKTVEEILEMEAAQGNQEAIKFAADMFTNPTMLIELFQLSDSNNKLVILQSLSGVQLHDLIPLLEVNDMVEGLKFFSQEGLMNLFKDIPKEELLKTVFQLFSEEQLIELMPEKQLDSMLTNFKTDKNHLLKNLKNIPQIYLQQIVESVTGEEATGNSREMVDIISRFNDGQYKAAIKNLRPLQKRELTLALTKSEPEYYKLFDTDAYLKIMYQEREKPDIIKAMGVIKPEFLEKMMEKLPDDLLSIVITQVDTEKFAATLINEYPETLAKFVVG